MANMKETWVHLSLGQFFKLWKREKFILIIIINNDNSSMLCTDF